MAAGVNKLHLLMVNDDNKQDFKNDFIWTLYSSLRLYMFLVFHMVK